MDKLLELKDLTKKYHDGPAENKAADHVDLEVYDGEFVIIMGASGSGKTSLLHLIAGIDDLDEGMIKYQDIDYGQMNRKERTIFRRNNIGMVFQQQCLIPDLTVYENIMLPLMINRRKRQADSPKSTILNLCRQFGLEQHVRKYPSQLSGGQQQRAAILRAIVNKPPVLLCDEPTGSLNQAQSDKVMNLLEELNQNGQTIILVTHDVKAAIRGSRIVYIEDGRIEGELKFAETGRRHSCIRWDREEKLLDFLKERGW